MNPTIAATKTPLTHDGDSRSFHLADGRSIHLTRNSAVDYRVVVLDYQGRIADPAYARNFTSETEARATARGWFCELTGTRAPAVRITVVDDYKMWASRGKRAAMSSTQRAALTEAANTSTGEIHRSKDHTITTLKALVRQGWATAIEGAYANWATPATRKTLTGVRITKHGLLALAEETARRATTPAAQVFAALAAAA